MTPKRKTRSVLNLQKGSDKYLTPFQKHEEEYHEMFKKNTIDTKASSKGQSLSFLKSLMKEVRGTDSRYEKMEIVREKVRSYVNPELTMTKTLRAQKLIFDDKKF